MPHKVLQCDVVECVMQSELEGKQPVYGPLDHDAWLFVFIEIKRC